MQVYEALQIAFYFSLAIYIIVPLIYAGPDDFVCEDAKMDKRTCERQSKSGRVGQQQRRQRATSGERFQMRSLRCSSS